MTVSYQGLTATVAITVMVNDNPLNLGFRLLKESDSYELWSVHSSDVSELVIPSTYDSKPVTSIANNTFEWNSSLKSITIPASITKIDSMATSVSSVYYDGTVTDWCKIQFKGTSEDNITNPMKSAKNFYIKNGEDYAKLTSVAISSLSDFLST